MQEIPQHVPEGARYTAELVDSLNEAIRRGDPDPKVMHAALTGLIAIVGQLENLVASDKRI